jgi:hypothetical protein
MAHHDGSRVFAADLRVAALSLRREVRDFSEQDARHVEHVDTEVDQDKP